MSIRHLRLASSATLFGLIIPCAGATLTLDAVDSGNYRANGIHAQAIENHLTGLFNQVEYRSFFVFDLSSIAGTVNSATLRLFNPEVSEFLHGYVSPDPTETLNIYDVTTSAASITGNTAGLAGFADLGSGTLFGTTTVSVADNGFVVEIALNASAVSALDGGSGLFVLGGALSTVSGTEDQHVFGFSTAAFVADHTRQLVLDVTPDPGSEIPEPSAVSSHLHRSAGSPRRPLETVPNPDRMTFNDLGSSSLGAAGRLHLRRCRT